MSADEKEVKRMELEMLSEKFNSALSDVYIDPSEEVELPPVAISQGTYKFYSENGVEDLPLPLCTYGNISVIMAYPKVGKSFCISLLTSTFLAGHVQGRSGDIRGHNDGRGVLQVDTEQSKFHSANAFRRNLRMTGELYDDYHTLSMRELSPYDRRDFIEWYIEEKMGGEISFLVIDGIADLIYDVNDLKEVKILENWMLRITSQYNCHMMTVIHLNEGSQKMTGHLGSSLGKKVETGIMLQKNKNDFNMVDAHCKITRNKAFEDFSFKIEKGLPYVYGDFYDVLDGVPI